jgi:hypothetical protein
MRFYLDLDLKSPGPFEETLMQQFEAMMLPEIRRFYPSDAPEALFEALVLSSGVREVDLPKGEGRGFKAGVHYVFQNLYVTVEQALHISSALIAGAERALPAPEGVWRDRIDQAVYGETRGLRWAWQFKSSPCLSCSKETSSGTRVINARGCAFCSRGQVPNILESMYSPVYFLGGDSSRRLAGRRFDPTVDLLLAASIRAMDVAQPTDGFLLYPGAPARPELRAVKRTVGSAVYSATLDGDAETKRASAKGNVVAADSLQGRALLAAIRRSNPKYRDLAILSITQFESGRGFKVFVKGFGSKYCQNVRRDHTNSAVRFIVSMKGVHQECFSKKPSDKVFCGAYKSPLTPLTEEEQRLLFGGKPHKAADGADLSRAMFMSCGSGPGSGPGSDPLDLDVCRGFQTAAAALQERMARHPVPPSVAALSPMERDICMTNAYIKRRKITMSGPPAS